uniref:Hemopexin n=1 Tax=Salarias fasciatus TaxID=181472 RepID=A0A672H3K1_SALFA
AKLLTLLCIISDNLLTKWRSPAAVPDRCQGIEMDAVTVNEDGIPYFFHSGFLFKGFHGAAERANETFTELDEHQHLGHVDAAFRLHYEDHPTEHNNIIFFLDTQIFSYYQHKLEGGYPKNISEVYPGIPDHLDAAVECPKPECEEDSVIFFKGDEIFHFNFKTKAVEMKEFTSMPNCTSAFRFMEHYYCFHGHNFSKFDPKTGEVHGRYPKEARDFFMRCSKFSDDSDHVERERCSRAHLDAITADNEGDMFAFRGQSFICKEVNDTLKVEPIELTFKEVKSDVDAAFTFKDDLYLVKDEHVFAYRVGENHTLLDGYPKTVKEELGIEGPIDSAFSCDEHQHVHVVKGQLMYDVDMAASERNATNERSIMFPSDAAMCGPRGVTLVKGNHFYHFDTLKLLFSRAVPERHQVSLELFGCDH